MSWVLEGKMCAHGDGQPGSVLYRDEWVCRPCYQREEFAPGHVRTGDAVHFMGHCHDCDAAHYLPNLTLDQVETWYRRALFDQDVWEAYCHVWATSAYRYSTSWTLKLSPVDPEVVRLVAIMRGGLALKVRVSA